MTLQEQLAQVQQQTADEKAKGPERDMELIQNLEQQEADILHQMMVEEQEKAAQERVQAQEERVESISLPYDFSEVFGDPRANDIVIELIKEFQRTAYADHNAEVELLISEHKAELAEVKRSSSVILNGYNELSIKYASISTELVQVKNERDDAISKRDAAVRQAEGLETLLAEKQAHIDQLRDEIAVGAKAAVQVTNISPSDRLAQLVQDSKNAKVKSALDIALENTTPFRGKVLSDGQAVAPLVAPEVPNFPIVNPSGDTVSTMDSTGTTDVPAEDTVTPSQGEVQAVRSDVVSGNASEDGQTLQEAFRRIEALELKLGV